MGRPRTAVGLALVLVAALALAGFSMAEAGAAGRGPKATPPGQGYEIWALDQGTGVNRINVYDQDLAEVAVIDLDGILETPHMVDFDSSYRYAFVAGTRGGGVAVIRTSNHKVVATIPTGAGAHMAAVTPDDSAVWVANIGARTFTEIVLDLEGEEFTLGRELAVDDDPRYVETYGDWDSPPAPVCHEYTADSRYAYVTLGPAAGGLVVVDLEDLTIVEAFDPSVVKANCGLARSADGAKMYANAGSATGGEWYVLDTSDHTLVGEGRSSHGIDAHGARITPDGTELWQVNRVTSNAIVVDTATDEVIDEIEFVGKTPDILDFSPDGSLAFVTLRGPHPQSAPHVAVGETPGFAVVDVATRELLTVVEPAKGTDLYEASDFHGIGVRPLRATQARANAPGQAGR